MPERTHQTSLPGMEDPAREEAAASVPAPAPKAPAPEAPLLAAEPVTSLAGQSVYVVDSHSLIYQVFHALPEMTSPRGEPVGAVYGFVRDMLFLLESKQPDILLCAFDLPGKTFRHTLYDAYKADRSEMPEALRPQIPAIRQLLDAMGIPTIDYDDHEADDVLATIARQCRELSGTCYVVTGDKDCRQLITPEVQIYNIRKNDNYDATSLEGDWGIRPDQVVDFQSLVGDSVDNVPGVPLIGPKIAGELLRQHDTLEAVLDAAEEMKPGKRRLNLIEFREQALLSRELVRLKDDLPLKVDWNAGRVGDIDHAALGDLFNDYGFRSFGERVAALDAGQAPKQWQADYQTIDTPEALADLIRQMKQQNVLCVDTETTSLSPRHAKIVGYALAWEEGVGYYVPVLGPEGSQVLDPIATRDALRDVLEDPAIKKVGQNLKYDMVVLRSAGIELAGVDFDTMVASYLLEAGERNHNLDELSKRYLNHTTIKISELIGTGKKQKRMDEVPVEQVGEYAAEDADIPLRLRSILEGKLAESGLEKLFHDVEMPLIEVLTELEFNGIRVDTERLAQLSKEYGQRIDAVEQEIYQLAGHELNIASPKQLAVVLFEELGLPVIKKTKTGASTDASVLEELARGGTELPAKIIEFRQFSKLKSTYVDALPELVHPETGRVHASFNQVVAATGRLSSSDPNLQNIPVRTAEGREIRSAFLPGPDGWQLLAADYSQIELRVLAHYCGDATLCEAFARDEDIHARVAAEVFDVPLDEVNSDQRRSAKAVNFGVIYGQSPFGLARSLNIEQDEAAAFIDSYFARYPGVAEFMERTLVETAERGYVSTILGRRRAIQGIRDASRRGDRPQLMLPERTAVNTVIQGSAADLIKLAMISIHRRLRESDLRAKMLLQIHDELIFEAPPEELPGLIDWVREEMVGVLKLDVPLKVDVKQGLNWAELEAV
jgi:DNA polymerase-1